MAHDDLQRLSLRLGVVGAMTAQAKETAHKLAGGADEYERAILKRLNTLSRQISRQGVGKDPKADQEYCQLLMQRRRMLQSYELAKQDAAKAPDVQVGKKLQKGFQSLPFEVEPTIYLIAHCATSHNEGIDQVTGWQDPPLTEEGRRCARELAVSLSSAGIEALACSDLRRAVETATILHEVLGVPVAPPQPGFRAWNLGVFEGQPEKDAGPLIRPFITTSPSVAVPGGESFDTYHRRFMTSLVPMLILVGRGVRHTIGIITHSKCLLMADAWLHSGGSIGGLNLDYYVGKDVEPGTVLRMTLTPTGWVGKIIPPTHEEQAPGLFVTALPPDMTMMKALSKKPQPGQLGFGFDEEAHPREPKGEKSGKYRGGEFVPKDQGGTGGEKLTLYRQGDPVGRSGAGTFYTFDPRRLERNPQRYEKTFHNILDVPKEMHDDFAGNPSESLMRKWLPHLDPHKTWLKYGKRLGHKSGIDTVDWLVAHAAHERGYDGIRYEGLEMQSLLDGFEPNPLFEKMKQQATVDPREDWEKSGVRSQAFKKWFGDWEHNPKMASKVVGKDGKPKETYEVDQSQVTDKDTGEARIVYHGTGRGGFTEFDVERQDPGGLYGPGFYFTEDQSVATSYLKKESPLRGLDRRLTEQDIEKTRAIVEDYKHRFGVTDGDAYVAAKNILRAADKGPEALELMLGGGFHDLTIRVRTLLHVRSQEKSSKTVYSVYLNIRRPFDVEKRYDLGGTEGEALKKALEELGAPTKPIGKTYKGEWGGQHVFNMLKSVYEDAEDRSVRKMGRTAEEFAVMVLKKAGYDGITHVGGNIKGGGHLHKVWIAFKPEQIKSAENEGTFDPTNPDILKALTEEKTELLGSQSERAVFVPPDMPRWQKRPSGGGQRYLPLNGIEDGAKLRQMVDAMKAGEWDWDQPIIHSGDQLLTGSHRYVAAKEAGVTIPLKDFGEVCQEGGVDFEKEWRARAEPFGGWISNVSNVIRLLPPGLTDKYGIELG